MNVYATLVRNSMPYLAGNLYSVRDRLANKGDKIVIIENDSDDIITRSFLEDFYETTRNNEVSLYFEDINAPKYKSIVSLERANAMASYRNKYLDAIIQHNWNPEYLIVFDSDMWDLPKENFDSMFTENAAVSSNGTFKHRGIHPQHGYMEKHFYYDTWAYQALDDDTIHVSEKHSNNLESFTPSNIYDPSAELIEVRSGFGGLAVYKWDLVKDCRYAPYEFGGHSAALCEHGGLNKAIRDKGEKVYINVKYKPEVRV